MLWLYVLMVHLFICELFNNGIINSNYGAWNGVTID